MLFVLLSIVLLFVGRKVGWAISKAFLYQASAIGAAFGCCLWGLAVAGAVFGLILWLDPHIVLKIIFGYALGLYVAQPAFGLVREDSIPHDAMPRHRMIGSLPSIVYVLWSVVLGVLHYKEIV